MVVTFGVVSALIGSARVVAFGREIPASVVLRANALVLIALAGYVFGLLFFIAVDPEIDALPAAFDVMSALANCGWSQGASQAATQAGANILIMMMFVGRLGPLVIASLIPDRPARTIPLPHRSGSDRLGALMQVAVLGLGRFGSHLAEALDDLGHEVLAIDLDEGNVHELAPRVTDARIADITDIDALRALALAEVDVAVVATADLEASVLAMMNLKQLSVETVYAKASSDRHQRILRLLGAKRVIRPERDGAERFAHINPGRFGQ